MAFFTVGSVTVAEDSDIEYFVKVVKDDNGWQQVHSAKGICVFTRNTEDTSYKLIKSRVALLDVSAAVMFDVLQDPEYRKVWDKSMVEGYDICQVNDHTDIGYYSMRSFPPFSSRDFVTERSWFHIQHEYVIFNHSVYLKSEPPRRNCVRAISYLAGYHVQQTGSNSCIFTYVAQCDPRGKLPVWAVNKASEYLTPKVMQRIVKVAKLYPEWKKANSPNWKPWVYTEQMNLRHIDWDDVTTVPDNTSAVPDESQSIEATSVEYAAVATHVLAAEVVTPNSG